MGLLMACPPHGDVVRCVQGYGSEAPVEASEKSEGRSMGEQNPLSCPLKSDEAEKIYCF